MDLATESAKIGIRQYSSLFSLLDGESGIKRTMPGDIEKWKYIPESLPPVQLLQIQWEIKLMCRPPFWPLITGQARITIAARVLPGFWPGVWACPLEVLTTFQAVLRSYTLEQVCSIGWVIHGPSHLRTTIGKIYQRTSIWPLWDKELENLVLSSLKGK